MENEKKVIIELTDKEFDDVKRGLHIAMITLDNTGNTIDIMLSDRLEKIFNRMSEQ